MGSRTGCLCDDIRGQNSADRILADRIEDADRIQNAERIDRMHDPRHADRIEDADRIR